MLTKMTSKYGVNKDLLSRGLIIDYGLITVTLLVGMFLPLVTTFISADGMINILWGSVYGLGFFFLQLAIGLYRGGAIGLLYGLAGFILWPAIVAYILARWLQSVRRKEKYTLILIWRICVVLSIFISIPISHVQDSFAETLPLFTKYIDF